MLPGGLAGGSGVVGGSLSVDTRYDEFIYYFIVFTRQIWIMDISVV